MASTSATLISTAVAVATFASQVNAHGYMLIPQTQFSGTATGAWSVQIDPPSGYESSDWNGNTQKSVDAWKSLAPKNGFKDLKTLLDGDTSLYGPECGFSNPNGTPQPIPSTSTATFERAIQHVGPCEIWLDDTKVFSETDCYSTYGNENKDIKSVFPVDYSQCETTGCSEMRFYWLAFQGIDGKTVWQTYKDCIPLKGGSGTGKSTSSSTNSTSTTTEAPATETPVTDAPTTEAPTTDAPETEAPTTDAPETEAPATEAPATEAPATDAPADEAENDTPAPSSKCSARKRS